MDSDQYEELCRHFVARELGLGLNDVKSAKLPNPKRPDLPAYTHQIDLYWETTDPIALYFTIANAKWRAKDKVDQPDVLLLQQVRQKLAAHKALMITSVGFTEGAVAAAKDDGIALHILQPDFDVSALPRGNREAIRAALSDLAGISATAFYKHRIEHRGLDVSPQIQGVAHGAAQLSRPAPSVQTRVAPPSTTLIAPPSMNRPLGGGGGAAGRPGPGPTNRGGGGFSRRG